MALYKFVLHASEVATYTMPDLHDPPGSPPIDLCAISHSDLSSVGAYFSEKEIQVIAIATNVAQKLATAATTLLNAALPNSAVKYMVARHSRPSGSVWEPTTDIYLHPSSNGDDECVSFEYSGGTGVWYELSIVAEQIVPLTAAMSRLATQQLSRKKKLSRARAKKRDDSGR